MALNESIYIFTIVTVLFAPVSFLAVRPTPKKPGGKGLTVWPADVLGLAILEQRQR